ncbi:MAG: hypothetical protein ACFFCQ_00600 [Promethearchaeota archaeon]
MVKPSMIVAGILIIIGILAAGIGIFVPAYVDSQITSEVKDALILKNDPEDDDDPFDEFFAEPDLEEDTPIYISFHFYNITNYDEVINGTTAPVFEELDGDYTIRKVNTPHQYTGADIPTGYDSEEYIVYGEDSVHIYVAEESNFTGTENIIQFNPAYYAVLAVAGSEQNLAVSVTASIVNGTIYQMAGEFLASAGNDFAVALQMAEAQYGNLTYAAPSGVEAAAYVFNAHAYYLNFSQAWMHHMLYTPNIGITNATMLGYWLINAQYYILSGFANATAYAALNTPFAAAIGQTFTPQQIAYFTEYLQYVMDNSAKDYIYDSYRAGFIAKRTIHEWMYSFIDPLAGQLTAFQSNNSAYTSEKIVMNTGTEDIDEIWQEEAHWDEAIDSFTTDDGKTLTGLWVEDETISGTDAANFAPDVDKDEKLVIFNTDTWRKLDLSFVREVTKKDIDMYRYHLDYEEFKVNPNYYQYLAGFANMTVARGGLPVYLSLPHAFNNSEDHPDFDTKYEDLDIIIDVEPISGVVMNAHKRLQMNLGISTTELYFPLKDMPTALGFTVNYADGTSVDNFPFAPIFWGDEHGIITDADAKKFRDDVYDIQEIGEMVGLIGLIGGPIFIFAGAIVAVVNYTKYNKPE